MWRSLLAFACHRGLLLAVALTTLNVTLPKDGPSTPTIRPMGELWGHFMARVETAPDYQSMTDVFQFSITDVVQGSRNPFNWVARWFGGLFPIPKTYLLLFLSNLFFLLFLFELNTLINRMSMPEVASAATTLMVFWVTSFEMSLGSSFSLTCLLALGAVRHALDNRWLVSGLHAALLAISGPLIVGLFPILLFIFVYFQRHFFMAQIIKRALFFVVPVGAVAYWKWDGVSTITAAMSDSVLGGLYAGITGNHGIGWLTHGEYLPQLLTLIFFAVATVMSFSCNLTAVHRLIPINFFLLWGLFVPYGNLASRAGLVAVCLQGIAVISSTIVTRAIRFTFIGLGIYECVRIFSAG